MAAVDAERGGAPSAIAGLHGLGGIGKTALALKLAEQLTPRYPDAQFYLDLKGVAAGTAGDKPLSPADAMAHVIRAYHPTSKLPDSEAELRGMYQSALYGKRALLLLDNARDAAQVAPLLPPPGCIAIITSRQHFTLSGLQSVNLEKLPPGDAKDLIKRIVTRLSAEQLAGALDEMARLCGYLPLALRASASALQERIDLSPTDYVRRLRGENQRLQLEGIKAEGVPISVAASFNLSYQLLTEAQQNLWRALAVFPDSFDRAAAAVVWELDPSASLRTSPDPAQDVLSGLLKYSLLDRRPSPVGALPGGAQAGAGGEGRYRLHDLARLFADSRLGEDERYAAQQGHATHYATVLSTADDFYVEGGEPINRGLALYDLEWMNIQAGLAWAEANVEKDNTAARLCSNYIGGDVLDLRVLPRERIRWLEAALAAARSLNDLVAEGGHLGNLGHAYSDLSEHHRAIDLYEQALAIFRELDDHVSQGTVLGNLGLTYADLGELSRAVDLFNADLTIARKTDNRYSEGHALGNLGRAYFLLSDYRLSIEFFEKALQIFREISYQLGVGQALSGLGNAYSALGETRPAIELHKQHLLIVREIGDRLGESYALTSLGELHLRLREPHKAIGFCEQALVIANEIGDRRAEVSILSGLGSAYLTLDEISHAIELYEKTLMIASETGDRRGESAALAHLGTAYNMLGESRKAIEFYERALAIARQIGELRFEGDILWNTSMTLNTLGDRAQAIAHAEAALKIFKQIEIPDAEIVRKQLAEWGLNH